MKISFIFIFSFLIIYSCEHQEPLMRSKEIKAFFYEPEENVSLSSFDSKKVDYIYFAFLEMNKNGIYFKSKQESNELEQLLELKNQNDKLEVVSSLKINSWLNEISRSRKNKTHIKRAVQQIKNFSNQFPIDMLDLYIENFRKEDNKFYMIRNLQLFISALKAEFDENLRLSLSCEAKAVSFLDYKFLSKNVSHINLLTYNFYTNNQNRTGHQANMYTSTNNPKEISVDSIFKFVMKQGVQPEKLFLGIPLFKTSWTEVDSLNRGLYVNSNNSYELTNNKLDSMLNNKSLVKYWDDEAKSAYHWDAREKIFISVEDSRTIKYKCDYVKKYNLGGVIIWNYSNIVDPFIEEINYWLQ